MLSFSQLILSVTFLPRKKYIYIYMYIFFMYVCVYILIYIQTYIYVYIYTQKKQARRVKEKKDGWYT